MSGEVRLWRSPQDRWLKFSQPSQPNEPYIALPAAEFEAWRRVVEAARAVRATVPIKAAPAAMLLLVEALGALPSARKEGHK